MQESNLSSSYICRKGEFVVLDIKKRFQITPENDFKGMYEVADEDPIKQKLGNPPGQTKMLTWLVTQESQEKCGQNFKQNVAKHAGLQISALHTGEAAEQTVSLLAHYFIVRAFLICVVW